MLLAKGYGKLAVLTIILHRFFLSVLIIANYYEQLFLKLLLIVRVNIMPALHKKQAIVSVSQMHFICNI